MDKLPEDVARLVERLEAGLEGVWRGQWAAGVVTDGDGREVPHDGYVSDIDGEGLDIEIKTYDDRAQKVARHIANCDPDTIRALLSALKAQATEIERLTKERYEWQVAAGRMAVDGAISEAKLREAVEVEERIRAEIPDRFILDPPDGGDVKTWEGVQRMRQEIERLEGKDA